MLKNSKFIGFLIAVIVLPSVAYIFPVEAAVYSAPSLVSPASNQVLTNYPRIATFKWSAVSGAYNYQLEVACDTCISKTNLYASAKTYAVGGTSYTVQVPGADNTFRWRVRIKDYSGNYGPWSSYLYFKYNTSGNGGSDIYTNTASPIISAPLEGQTIYSNSVTLLWNSLPSVASYEVNSEYKSNGNWHEEGSYTGITASSKTLVSLPANDYRFRVRAKHLDGTYTNWSDWRNFKTSNGSNASNIGVPALISPADESSINNSGVNFDWSTVSGATSYEYQVTRYTGSEWASVSAGTVSDSNVYVALPYSTYGMYSFRVRAIQNGNYGNWSEYNQFYYYSGAGYNYGTPVIYTPEDTTYTSHSIYMSWSGVLAGEIGYEINVQYESNSNWYEEGTYTSINPNYTKYFNSDNHYRMRVRAKFSNGSFGTWSAWREFRVGESGSYNYGAPTIYSPYENQNFTSYTVNMNWSNVSGASNYEINIQYESYGSWYEEGTYTTANTGYSKYFSNANEYRMRVRAKNSTNSYGSWSDWRRFTVGDASNNNNYSAPTIYNPLSGVNYTSQQVYINWSSVSGAVSYEINIQYESYGSWYEEGTYSTTNAYYSKYFSNSNEYRLRVRAKFQGSSYGNWSEWRNFTVGDTGNYSSGAPVISSPAQNALVQNTSRQISLSWSGVYNAQSYQIEIARDGYATETLNPGNVTSYTYNSSADNAWYHFRVRANLGSGNYSAWSEWRYFQYYYSTSGNTASPPIITSPTANQTIYSSSVTFNWLNVSGANGYEIDFGYLSGSNWISEQTANVSTNYYTRNFTSSNTYHVRVRAKFSDSSATGWSDWVQFRIQL